MIRQTIQRRSLLIGLAVVLVAIAGLVVLLARQGGEQGALRSVDTPAAVEAEAPAATPIPSDQVERAGADDQRQQDELGTDLDAGVPSEAEVPPGAADLDADAADLAADSRDPYFEEQVTEGE